jgi:hypothetical protein
MAGSSTPAGLHAPCRSGAAAWPPREERRGLPHWDFRSSIAAPQSSLSTLRMVGCPTATQNSLPAAGQALLGGLDYPQGFAARFRKCTLHLIPLSRTYLAQSPFLFVPLSFFSDPIHDVPFVFPGDARGLGGQFTFALHAACDQVDRSGCRRSGAGLARMTGCVKWHTTALDRRQTRPGIFGMSLDCKAIYGSELPIALAPRTGRRPEQFRALACVPAWYSRVCLLELPRGGL